MDCARRQELTFGLRDERVREFARSKGRPEIFVHAHCKFRLDAELDPDEFFLRNRGPEIFLPTQPLIYFALILLSALGIGATAVRLVRFPGELAPPK